MFIFFFFFFNDTATTEIYTLSLHDALPISPVRSGWPTMLACTWSRSPTAACMRLPPRPHSLAACPHSPRCPRAGGHAHGVPRLAQASIPPRRCWLVPVARAPSFLWAPLRYSLLGLGGSRVTACAGRRKTASMTHCRPEPYRQPTPTCCVVSWRLCPARVDPALAGPS